MHAAINTTTPESIGALPCGGWAFGLLLSLPGVLTIGPIHGSGLSAYVLVFKTIKNAKRRTDDLKINGLINELFNRLKSKIVRMIVYLKN